MEVIVPTLLRYLDDLIHGHLNPLGCVAHRLGLLDGVLDRFLHLLFVGLNLLGCALYLLNILPRPFVFLRYVR